MPARKSLRNCVDRILAANHSAVTGYVQDIDAFIVPHIPDNGNVRTGVNDLFILSVIPGGIHTRAGSGEDCPPIEGCVRSP